MTRSKSNIASLSQGQQDIPESDGLATPQDHYRQYLDGPPPHTEPRYATRQQKRQAISDASSASSAKRAKAKKEVWKPVPAIHELPHNLGKIEILDAVAVGSTQESVAHSTPKLHPAASSPSQAPYEAVTSKPRRNRGPRSPYGLTPGISPFPDWQHPTIEECEEVNRLLSSAHGKIIAPKAIPPPSLTVSGCGEVPSILDALIRTLLSGATTGNNSAMAFQGLVRKFGILNEGIGKGSVNWNKVREAPVEDIYEAMKCGGLGVAKSKYIKQILEMVYTENRTRRDALVESKSGKHLDLTQAPGSVKKTEEQKDNEIAMADENVLSLNHLHSLSKDEAMLEFVKYPGIGVKTAACVVLFCLQRPCFAVDTHVFRLSKWLGWIPSDKVNEITAFSHLEVRIPDNLKYSLHQLFIHHGKACPRCRAITTENSQGWETGCVIDRLVQRTGKKKDGPLKQTKLSFKVNKLADKGCGLRTVVQELPRLPDGPYQPHHRLPSYHDYLKQHIPREIVDDKMADSATNERIGKLLVKSTTNIASGFSRSMCIGSLAMASRNTHFKTQPAVFNLSKTTSPVRPASSPEEPPEPSIHQIARVSHLYMHIPCDIRILNPNYSKPSRGICTCADKTKNKENVLMRAIGIELTRHGILTNIDDAEGNFSLLERMKDMGPISDLEPPRFLTDLPGEQKMPQIAKDYMHDLRSAVEYAGGKYIVRIFP
ncbi:hypothetical protein MGYG_00265 [Nannizzia gypsea CBS 118893]|uniref:HhH-GPD domain-containing protein n=1 Tax=Arthroderma gypseum (strain ATCC MYA-4604 / CBS 118893) TaxID=535722 RepID=E5QYD1_ARTGP|nr:hypothetical protein MGYG_00265 [Nannizzia gypsea CBS 118893]EFQ97223.1 hypothetical protein MGYG_00265 [Nannizzia gypsea CBS 118893]